MKVKEFETKTNIEIIQDLINENHGYITSKQLSELGIHRMYLNLMLKKGLIEKVDNGIYISQNTIPDVYYIFNLNNQNIVYSHLTALYFFGLTINAPYECFDVTVPNNYYNYKLKGHNVFYVDRKYFNLGLTCVKTNSGNLVKSYDVERCICDIIKSKNRIDSQYVKYSVKQYLKYKNKDLIKLSKYASILGIKDEVMSYLEVLSD